MGMLLFLFPSEVDRVKDKPKAFPRGRIMRRSKILFLASTTCLLALSSCDLQLRPLKPSDSATSQEVNPSSSETSQETPSSSQDPSSSSPSSQNSSADSQSSSSEPTKALGAKKTGNIYQPTEDNGTYKASLAGTITYRMLGSIPYVDVGNYFETFLEKATLKSSTSGVYAYRINNVIDLIVDANADTVSFNDYDLYLQWLLENEEIGNVVSFPDASYYVQFSDNQSCTYVSGGSFTFDLSDYGLDIIEDGGEIYLPFASVDQIFFAQLGYSFVFNGNGFYLSYSSYFSLDGSTLTSYGKSYFKNSFTKDSEYAAFNYQMLCFQIDHFYGFLDQKLTPFDSYLKNNNSQLRANLLSTNETTYAKAIDRLMNELIGDGHTGSEAYGSIFSSGIRSDSQFYYYYSDRMYALSEAQSKYESLRKQRLGSSFDAVRFSGSTAIVSFDEFACEVMSFTTGSVKNYVDTDTFAFLYDAFSKIDAHGGVENVIFDITLNGGGTANTLIAALGWMAADVNLNIYNPLTGSKSRLYYSVDTNLDGQFNAADVRNDFNFYILASNLSFSCANAFPAIAKSMGVAKIIGETSGGGACVVFPSATIDGMPYQISGISRISTVDSSSVFTDVDAGVTPDYPLDTSYFYNDAKLASYVESL